MERDGDDSIACSSTQHKIRGYSHSDWDGEWRQRTYTDFVLTALIKSLYKGQPKYIVYEQGFLLGLYNNVYLKENPSQFPLFVLEMLIDSPLFIISYV